MFIINTNEELDVLEHIFITGGYTNVYNLMDYKKLSRKKAWKVLEELSQGSIKQRYLKKVNQDTRARADKMIYQVTGRTCTLFDSPNSYYRKRHNEEYIRRALLRNRFYSLHSQVKSSMLFGYEDRIKFLISKGYIENQLPKKYYGKRYVVSIEENIEVIDDNNICLHYIDKENITIKQQVITLISNYSQLISINHINIYFKIITTSKIRATEFLKELSKYISQLYSIDDEINDSLLQLYVSYLKSTIQDSSEIDRLINDYRDGSIEENVIETCKTLNVSINEIIDTTHSVFDGDINSVIKLVKDLSDENKHVDVVSVFNYIFYLNYSNLLVYKDNRCAVSISIIDSKLT